MFAMHPLPSTTQRTNHHLYEVNTSATREISNHHLILFCVKRWNKADDVNISIPWWRNFGRWQNNSLQSSSSLPPIWLLRWKLEYCCLPNRLVIVSFWLNFKICMSITRSYTFIRKQGSKAHLCASHRTNPASSKVVTSNWVTQSQLSLATLMGQVAYWHNISFQFL